MLLETTPDGHDCVWLVYQPEPWFFDSPPDQEINLWCRRCTVHASRETAADSLERRIGERPAFRPYHPLFPELWIWFDSRGYRWLMESAALDPLVKYG